MMDKIIEGTKKSTEGSGASRPSVIADAIAEIDLARFTLRHAINPPPGNRILESGQILNEAGY